MTPWLLIAGLAVNAVWAWRAVVACRRTGHRTLAIAVIVFAAGQAWLWGQAEPFGRGNVPAARATLETATVLWTATIAPGSLLVAGVARWRRRRGREGVTDRETLEVAPPTSPDP